MGQWVTGKPATLMTRADGTVFSVCRLTGSSGIANAAGHTESANYAGSPWAVSRAWLRAGTLIRLLILETIHKGVQTARRRYRVSLLYTRSHAGVLSTVMIGNSTPMRQLTVETLYDETAGYNAMSLVSRTQMPTLPRPGIGMDANAHPCPTVSRICCLTDNPGGGAGWEQCRPSSDTGCQRGVSQGTLREKHADETVDS